MVKNSSCTIGSAQWSSLKGRERAIVNQMNVGVEHVWVFLSAQIPSWTELGLHNITTLYTTLIPLLVSGKHIPLFCSAQMKMMSMMMTPFPQHTRHWLPSALAWRVQHPCWPCGKMYLMWPTQCPVRVVGEWHEYRVLPGSGQRFLPNLDTARLGV